MIFNLEILGTNGYGKIFLLNNVNLELNDIPSLNSFINDIKNISFLIIEQKGGYQTLILPLYNENIINNFDNDELNKIIDNLYTIKNNLVFNTNIFNKLKELNNSENTLTINIDTFKDNLLKHFNYLHLNINKYKSHYDFLRNKETIDLYDFNLKEFNDLYLKYIVNDKLEILNKFDKNDYYKLFFKSRFLFFDKDGEIIKIPLHLNEGIIKSNTNFLRSLEELETFNSIKKREYEENFFKKFIKKIIKKRNS